MKGIFFIVCTFILSFLYSEKVQGQSFSWVQGFSASNNGSVLVVGSIFDVNNNSYTIGYFSHIVDFDASSNIYNMGSSTNKSSMFLLKEDATGNFLWAKQFPSLSASATTSWSTNRPRITLDAVNNIYIFSCHIDSVDADPGSSTFSLPNNGTVRACIIKLDSIGNFIWAKEIYGAGPTAATFARISGVKIDTTTQSIYLTLDIGGTIDVDPGLGVYNVVTPPNSVYPLTNNTNVVIEKLDTAGNFIWAKQITGTENQGASQLSIDNQQNVYIAGAFQGTADFDPGSGVYNMTSAGDDAFVAKYDSAGNYIWAKQVGSGGGDKVWDLSLDPWGNAVVTGQFEGTVDFDPGFGVYNLTSNSTRSIFTLKLRNNGNFDWARKAGYSGALNEGRGITTDTSGNVYVISYGYPTQKYDSSGNLLWTLATPGTNGWITLDHQNAIYLSGTFSGFNQDFDPGPGTYFLSGTNTGSGFILKLCQQPTATQLLASAKTVCTGDTVLLTANAPVGSTYKWYQNGNLLPGTGNTRKATTGGTYIVETNTGCPGYDSVVLTFNKKVQPKFYGPLLPSTKNAVSIGQWFTIYASQFSVNDTASFFNLDWYKNGVLDTSTIAYVGPLNYPLTLKKTTSASDSFFVVLYRKGFPCCVPDTSNTLIIQGVNGINDPYTSTSVAIYPNPSSGLFIVSAVEPINSLVISDMFGKEIQTTTPNTNQTAIDLHGKARGVYFYTLCIGEKKLRGKLVLE